MYPRPAIETQDLSGEDLLEATVLATGQAPPAQLSMRSTASIVTRNSLLSLGRLMATTLIALVLPAYLAHTMPVKIYGAWILILQMSAFVGYLDFGVQSAVAKYIAEYRALGNAGEVNRRVSAGLAIMLVAGVLGVFLTLLLAWRVPHIFAEMPAPLYPEVRVSLILVGVSLSVSLLCSVPAAIFLGLQRYAIPTVLALADKIFYTIVILLAVHLHWGLAAMGALVAVGHVGVSLFQVVLWKRFANEVRISLRLVDSAVLRQMLGYCSVLAVWTLGMLFVSGMDVTIVGHYEFSQTAFYSIATMPTNFMVAILGAAIGPLLPATSALSTRFDPSAMGNMLKQLTRYSVILLSLSGLPLLVCGYWLLTHWVGPVYANHAVVYLRVLVIANMIRNIGLPYATMLIATGRQKVAIAGAIAEAVVNISASVLLARHMGAVGVALGTLLGSAVSIGMHFAVGMHYSAKWFVVTRTNLFVQGVVRPLVMVAPTLLVARLWWSAAAPTLGPALWMFWAASTLLLGWFVGLRHEDRTRLLTLSRSRSGFGSHASGA